MISLATLRQLNRLHDLIRTRINFDFQLLSPRVNCSLNPFKVLIDEMLGILSTVSTSDTFLLALMITCLHSSYTGFSFNRGVHFHLQGTPKSPVYDKACFWHLVIAVTQLTFVVYSRGIACLRASVQMSLANAVATQSHDWIDQQLVALLTIKKMFHLLYFKQAFFVFHSRI